MGRTHKKNERERRVRMVMADVSYTNIQVVQKVLPYTLAQTI